MEKRGKTINDRDYVMLLPPVSQAMPLATRTAAMMAPLLGSLGGQVETGGWKMFVSATQNLDPDKLHTLMMDAVKVSHLCFNNEPISDPINYEKHFSRYRGDIYQVCLWVLWETVRDFFPHLGAFTQKLQEKAMKAASQFQQDGVMTGGSEDLSGMGSVPGGNSKTAR